ncbi:DUF2207 domain-containing protein [Candidatus Nomurabacteria bacterium]|nr:DUF2207 domain-containing protein [Candidatus Nomurabacteria bacterium]
MKKINLLITTIILGLFFLPAKVVAEVIKSFDSQIVVNLDSSISVKEIIVYDSEDLEKHGIFRDIRDISSQNEKIDIKEISVFDEQGHNYQWQKQNIKEGIRLKIGDPSTTFNGEKTYIIQYTATNSVAHLEGKDEIYWNVTGNNWPFPIEKVSANVILPGVLKPMESACYFGDIGSKEVCSFENASLNWDHKLNPNEGVTVAVGFESGILEHYISNANKNINLIKIISTIFPVIVFMFMLFRWYLYGRDPKGRDIIIPQYDIPDNLTPLEISAILNEKPKAKDISAEIIYLAVSGYIIIHQKEEKILGLIPNKEYELELIKDYSEIGNEFDKKILKALFGGRSIGALVNLSNLKYVFYKSIPGIFKKVKESILQKTYFKKIRKETIYSYMFFFFWTILSIYFLLKWEDSKPFIYLFLSGIISSFIINLFQRLMSVMTKKGIETKEYIYGLKEYLQIAEKDRLNFHNAPEKNPKVFEKLLPYAMILGVEKAWAKEFKDIYTIPPSWYESQNSAGFNSLVFVNTIYSFSHTTLSSLISSPSSEGGSGGSGSSGGGGGGGGGGSW